MTRLRCIAIVGASLAGVHAATTLRSEGYAGRLVMVGDEPHRPYDRPPLSKQLLRGEWGTAEGTLPFDVEQLDVEMRLGQPATACDLAGRAVQLADGSEVAFDGLVIATGATPRVPIRTTARGFHTLRTVDDALALRAGLTAGTPRVAIVGGGLIGLEVASTARGLGLDVTVVEVLDAPMAAVVGGRVAELLAVLHRGHGVGLRTGVAAVAVRGAERVEGLVLDDGSEVPADLVLMAVGVRPNTDWLLGSGLELDGGVHCDETLAAAPGVVVAGDVARWRHPASGELTRNEHWDNAVRQGRHAALRLLGGPGPDGPGPYAPVPWVWSDQHDRKIQIVGTPVPNDEVRIEDGGDSGRPFALYRRGDALVAAAGIDRARPVMRARQLLATGVSWDDALDALSLKPRQETTP